MVEKLTDYEIITFTNYSNIDKRKIVIKMKGNDYYINIKNLDDIEDIILYFSKKVDIRESEIDLFHNDIKLNNSNIRNIINDSINPLVFDCKLKNSNHDEEYIIVDITNDILNDILDVSKIIFNRIVTLDLEDFVNEIEKTFTDENEIEHQFNIDFPRSRVLINGIEINDCNSMKNYLRSTFDKEKVNRILMLSTQGVLGKPVELMYNYLLINNLHIGEKKFNSSRNPYTVYIDTYNGISFLIVKKMRIFKIYRGIDVTLCDVDLRIEFNIDIDKIVVLRLGINKMKNN